MTGPHEVRDGLGCAGLHVALECSDVGSGAEGAARPGDDDGTNGRIELDTVQDIRDSGNQLVAEGIQLVGPVQRKDQHSVPILTQEHGLGLMFSFVHRVSLSDFQYGHRRACSWRLAAPGTWPGNLISESGSRISESCFAITTLQ
jgi:hypothetical protein